MTAVNAAESARLIPAPVYGKGRCRRKLNVPDFEEGESKARLFVLKVLCNGGLESDIGEEVDFGMPLPAEWLHHKSKSLSHLKCLKLWRSHKLPATHRALHVAALPLTSAVTMEGEKKKRVDPAYCVGHYLRYLSLSMRCGEASIGTVIG